MGPRSKRGSPDLIVIRRVWVRKKWSVQRAALYRAASDETDALIGHNPPDNARRRLCLAKSVNFRPQLFEALQRAGTTADKKEWLLR